MRQPAVHPIVIFIHTARDHRAVVLRNWLGMHPNIPRRIENKCNSADATTELEIYPLAVCSKVIGIATVSNLFVFFEALGIITIRCVSFVYNAFQIPKPSANHHGIPANKIDLVSYRRWSTLSSYRSSLSPSTPAIYPTGWPYHRQEPRSGHSIVMPKQDSAMNQAEAPSGARKCMWHQTGKDGRRCQLGQRGP